MNHREYYIGEYQKQYPTVNKLFIEQMVDCFLKCPDEFNELVKKDKIRQRKGKEVAREIPDTIYSVQTENKSVADVEECLSSV
jgi:hypothetical protein